MKWHRGQQVWLALAAIVPGVLVYKKILTPPYASLILVVLYFCSKRHAFLVQRQFEREDHDRKVRDADEKQRLASLPARKRRAAERAAAKPQQENNDDDGAASGSSDHPKDE